MKKQQIVFLEGKKVILRPIEIEDLPFITQFINDPEIREFLNNTSPLNMLQEGEWIENIAKRTNDFVFGIVDKKKGNLIGNMGLHSINWISGTARTGAVIGDKSYWNKGYGTDAKMILLNHAFNTLNLRKIKSSALSFNKRSIRYSEKCGYKVEGVLKRELYRNGKYYDDILLSVFKKDWLPLWKEYNK